MLNCLFEWVDMRNHVNFRLYFVFECSFAISVGEMSHLEVCDFVCRTISPQGHPECADCKRIAHQYSCQFMLSLMLQQIVWDQTCSLYLRPSQCVPQRQEDWRQSEREREMVRTKGGVQLLHMALMFPVDEKESLKKKGKDHIDEKRRNKKGEVQKKK